MTQTLRLGTRGSALALAQSRQVAGLVERRLGRACELVVVRTLGDRNRGPLAQIGGTGVFVTALRDAIVSGQVDLAVHSLKDLPTESDSHISMAAVPERGNPADVLCAAAGIDLAGLRRGAVVGTGSPRRSAQLLRLRPDLRVQSIRGNVDTRLAAVAAGEIDAVVLAWAGLERLGRLDAVTQAFTMSEMVSAPAQGALAVECAAGRADLIAELALLDDRMARAAITAERAVLRALEAGCAAPVGAVASVRPSVRSPASGPATAAAASAGRGSLTLELAARVIAADGREMVERTAFGPIDDASNVGARLAAQLLAAGAERLMGSAE